VSNFPNSKKMEKMDFKKNELMYNNVLGFKKT